MNARALVAGALLIISVMLGWGGFTLASYALWELVSFVGELVELGRRGSNSPVQPASDSN